MSEPVVVAAMAEVTSVDFESFYRGARDRLVRALALTLGDPDLAAEAVDEAMARAYQRWNLVARLDNPGGWVYRVALNWSTSALRRRSRPPRLHRDRETQDLDLPPEPTVLAALDELHVEQRAVVVCRFYLGLNEAETAAALGIRPGTAKSRLHRGLNHLRTRIPHLAPEELS